MRVEIGHARAAFEFGYNLSGAGFVATMLQRQRQQRASVRLQVNAFGEQIVDVTRIGVIRIFAAHVQRVNQIGPRFGINRFAVFQLACVEQLFDAVASATNRIAVDAVTGALRHRQAVNHVSRHERIGLVVQPPAPTAIAVLQSVKPVKPALHLLAQIVRSLDRSRFHVLQRLRDDHVRQEARHRLLGAAVRKAGQIIERAEHRSGD
ncbi:MAG: hypothetical protein JMDDDDMK_01659 [Acidobacteria bacterium]|nr:hypothetical protein [Acidobacteriota bacterium]